MAGSRAAAVSRGASGSRPSTSRGERVMVPGRGWRELGQPEAWHTDPADLVRALRPFSRVVEASGLTRPLASMGRWGATLCLAVLPLILTVGFYFPEEAWHGTMPGVTGDARAYVY